MSPGDFTEGRVTRRKRRHHLKALALHPSLAKDVMERCRVGWGHVALPQIYTPVRVECFQHPHLCPHQMPPIMGH